jgi:ankyrin repeat protein
LDSRVSNNPSEVEPIVNEPLDLTVREFFQSVDESVFTLSTLPSRSPATPKLATACICFLNARHADARILAWKNDLDRKQEAIWRTDFLHYCSDFWGMHFLSNPSTDDIQHMLALETNTIICGLAVRHLLLNAIQEYKWLERSIHNPDPHTCMAYIAAIFDINAYWQHRVHNINEASFMEYTPLHFACIEGHKDGVERLLSLGANVRCKNWRGQRPLHFAAQNGHLEILELLLTQDATDVDSRSIFGNSPLHDACWHGHSQIVQLLLARDDVRVYHAHAHHPLLAACRSGHLQIVEMLLDRNDVHPELVEDIVLAACCGGNPEIVKLLLARENVQVDSRSARTLGRSPLWMAALYGHAEIVRMLLEREDVEMVNYHDTFGFSPLSIACNQGHMETVGHLLGRHDIDVNLTDRQRRSPLWTACSGGQMELVGLLLDRRKHDIDVNLTDDQRRSPLWAACTHGHMEVVELLLSRHVIEVNLRVQNPLWAAARYGHVVVVQRLLAWPGIEVESQEKKFKGQCPLEVAEKIFALFHR